MTTRTGLETVDFTALRALLAAVLPRGSRCALSNATGEIHAADEGFNRQRAARVLATLPQLERPEMGALPRPLRVRVGADRLFVAPLRGDHDEALAYLWAELPGTKYGRSATAALSAVADVVAQHLRLNAELDELAIELAERYEELNLVYHTADDVNYFADGQQALSQLVKNCCSYLSVRSAAIVMRDRGVLISYDASASDAAVSSDNLDALRTRVYDRVVADRETLVVNEPRASDLDLCRDRACRLLAAPLLDGNGDVIGILALLDDAEHARFSNSDKNLLSVMARKAVKIVQVSYDALTGLVNHEGFEYFAAQQLQEAQQQQSSEHAVLHIDIDQLRLINDTAGHDAGDAVIKSVAALLRRLIRDTDVVARLGGDEFGVLLRRCPLERGEDIAEKLRSSVAELVVPWKERLLTVTLSIGVAPIDDRAETAAAALGAARLASEAAKELGQNRVHCYQHSDTRLLKRQREMEIVGQIRAALDQDRFELYGQSIAALGNTDDGLHVEVLLRMRGENGEPLSPGLFLPAAERYHLMIEIDRWVVTHAIAFLNEHGTRFDSGHGLLSINLSGQSLSEPKFLEFVKDSLAGLAVPFERVCFEVTETTAVGNLNRARAFMSDLKASGCRFALDDFGSGLSSFNYLRSLPVDYLKIDGGIVRAIAEDPVAASMVAAVQQVARVMGLKTVGEFVENDAILNLLRDMGVSYAQGYAIDRPRPLLEFVASSARVGAALAR